MEHKYKLINEYHLFRSNDTTNFLKLNTFKKPCNCIHIHKKCLLKVYL